MFRRNPTNSHLPHNGKSIGGRTTNPSSTTGGLGWFVAILTIGLLLYVIFFQYLVIRSKESTILSLMQQQPSTISRSRFRCADTTRPVTGVGVFPRRKPSNRTIALSASSSSYWKPFSEKVLPKLSYPVFVTSLPKSGTTSIWKYFQCGHQLASHNWIQKVDATVSTMAGMCIQENIRQDRPPFQDCGAYDVYTDTGVRISDFALWLVCIGCLVTDMFLFIIPVSKIRTRQWRTVLLSLH